MIYRFGELFKWTSGKPVELTNGCIPVYGSNGIVGYTDDAKYENRIILGRVGAYCGSVSFCKEPFNATDNTLITTCDTSKIEYYFAYYLLRLYNLNKFAGGSAQPLITQSLLKHLKCDIPSVEVQQKISSILSAYDSLIENNTKRIKLLEQMAENLYKEWFVRFRFPGYENVKMENGLPKGWKVERVKKNVEICYGKDHKYIEDGDIPIYGSGGIMRYGNKYLFDGESVLIPRKGSLNNVMYTNGKIWTVDTMFYSKTLLPRFAKYFYYTISNMDLASFNSGAALPSMTTDILYHFKLLVPDLKILSAFDHRVESLFKQIRILQHQNSLLTRQRDLLLPRLMSGKLEVKP